VKCYQIFSTFSVTCLYIFFHKDHKSFCLAWWWSELNSLVHLEICLAFFSNYYFQFIIFENREDYYLLTISNWYIFISNYKEKQWRLATTVMATSQGIYFSQGNDNTTTWNPLRRAVKINNSKRGGKNWRSYVSEGFDGCSLRMRNWVLGCAHLYERLRLYNPVNPAPLRWASGWSIIFNLLLDCYSIFYNLANPFLLLDSFHFCTNISTRCWLLALPRCFIQSACSWHCNNSKVYFSLFSLLSLLYVSCCLYASQIFLCQGQPNEGGVYRRHEVCRDP
jgi:hypothetical protein